MWVGKMKILASILIIFLTTGAVILAQTKSPQSVQAQATTPQQRFQVVMNPNVVRDTFLVDAQTGRVWVETEITNLDGHPHIWKAEDRIDSEEEFIKWSTKKLELQNYQHAVDKAAKENAPQ